MKTFSFEEILMSVEILLKVERNQEYFYVLSHIKWPKEWKKSSLAKFMEWNLLNVWQWTEKHYSRNNELLKGESISHSKLGVTAFFLLSFLGPPFSFLCLVLFGLLFLFHLLQGPVLVQVQIDQTYRNDNGAGLAMEFVLLSPVILCGR